MCRPYPLGCGYIQPGAWTHFALSYTKDGRMHLTANGKLRVSDNAFWQGMAAMSGKVGPDYSTPAGPFAPVRPPSSRPPFRPFEHVRCVRTYLAPEHIF